MALTGTFPGIRIRAISVAVPETMVDNAHFVPFQGAENVRKFEKMVGVLERYHCRTATTRTLALASCHDLHEAGAWTAETVDACLFVSQTPDYRLPATACALHGDLGLRSECAAFDINLGCSGFTYGLYVAAGMLVSGGCRQILLTGGDCLTSILAPGDHANAMLFGDAGFAAVIERNTDGQALPFLLGSDGKGAAVIRAGGGGMGKHICGKSLDDSFLHMDGADVFDFTINVIPAAIKEFCDVSKQNLADFAHFAFHQANKFILKQIAMLTGFPFAKHLISIDHYGNTSSASIPLTLCYNRENVAGNTLLCGFGVGLSWGLMSYDFTDTTLREVRVVKD
ncbi:MAG: ketoacyl-ACP synthase III [Lentisphaerae bacterium]|jgi:3-oxoacyl-[acyl-carrier-protein] synthase-3|nr:ketoacyl-ACP synthase III [Lentisphaerota bacterium]